MVSEESKKELNPLILKYFRDKNNCVLTWFKKRLTIILCYTNALLDSLFSRNTLRLAAHSPYLSGLVERDSERPKRLCYSLEVVICSKYLGDNISSSALNETLSKRNRLLVWDNEGPV